MARSREAAKECSPRRKAWVLRRNKPSPIGAKEEFARPLFIPSGPPVQKLSPECTACGFEGHVIVKFKFGAERAIPVSAAFERAEQ